MLEIQFTKHMRDQQSERDDWLFRIDGLEESIEKDGLLEFKLRNKAIWYFDEKRTEETGVESYRCVIKNLVTYCAVKHDNKIIITTTFPHKQSNRGKLNSLEYIGKFSGLENQANLS